MNKDKLLAKIKERQERVTKENRELRYMFIQCLESSITIESTLYAQNILHNEGVIQGLRIALTIIDSEDTSD